MEQRRLHNGITPAPPPELIFHESSLIDRLPLPLWGGLYVWWWWWSDHDNRVTAGNDRFDALRTGGENTVPGTEPGWKYQDEDVCPTLESIFSLIKCTVGRHTLLGARWFYALLDRIRTEDPTAGDKCMKLTNISRCTVQKAFEV